MSEQDIVYDDLEDSSKSKIEKLKKELKKNLSEKQEYLEGWQRSKADYVNLKKRTAEEKEVIRNYAIEDFVLEIIGVVDSFEMALKDQETWNLAPENWRKGVEFIYNQLKNILKNQQIEEINPLHEKFDHNFHHSLKTIEVDDENLDGTILEVIQKGYKFKEKIIRFASVHVGVFKK